jgi:hypothetical protein
VPPQKDGKWKLEGSDLDGDDLSVLVVIDDGLLVVPLFESTDPFGTWIISIS